MEIMAVKDIEQEKRQDLAKRMFMWLFILAMFMVFAGLTSAYLVKKHESSKWLSFSLPNIFTYNTIILLLSSLTIHYAYKSAKKKRYQGVILGLWLTTVLGVVFLTGQFLGWQALIKERIYLVGNVAGSFIYVLSGLHALHLVAGVIVVFVFAIRALLQRLSIEKPLTLELVATFWHALDFLWLYLFVFLQINSH